MRSGITVRNSGVGRSTESLTGASGGTSSVLDGRYSRSSATAPSTSSDCTAHSPLAVAWTDAPPSWLMPTSIPVNSATICGPETKATASELMTTRSDRPSRSAGPETTGPVAAAMTGTCPLQREIAAAGTAPAVQGGHPVEDVGAARRHEEDEGDPELAGLVGGLGQPDPVRMGDGPAAHGAERPRNDRIAPADPPDHRRDGADDPLADVGRLLHAGHPDECRPGPAPAARRSPPGKSKEKGAGPN